jgi:hypothetical protein
MHEKAGNENEASCVDGADFLILHHCLSFLFPLVCREKPAKDERSGVV